MTERAIERRLLISAALLFVLIAVAWSGTVGGDTLETGPSWTGLRGALALGLIGLGLVFFERNRLSPSHSAVSLAIGALIASGFVVMTPAVLGQFDARLAGSELGLVGTIVAAYYLVHGSITREGESWSRRGSRARGQVALAVVLVLWIVLTTTPLSNGGAAALDLLAGLLWSGAGVYIVTVGFRRDDEVVSTLGIASLALGATQLLNLAGDPSPATEILGLGAVALAVACAYLDVAGLVSGQRSELDATQEAMRDLAHEARTAITAIEGTLFGLDSRSDLAPDDRNALKAALRIELQSLRLMLTRDRAEPVGAMRLASVLHPIATAAGLSGGRMRWNAPDDLEVQFAAGALTEIVRALLDNARTHSGTSRVEMEVETVDDRAEIRVIDHGRGVPSSMRRDLFERGTKGPGSPGRGLGLNIARRLARSHGGEVDHLDNPGGGARFVLSVPLATRVVDLTLYEDEQPVEIVDGDAAAPQGASPDGHRRDGFAREPHRHRGPQPGGEVAGV